MASSASISGLASGLDTATIISQLMQLEAIPQSRLKTQVTTHESAITKLQELNTKIAALFTKAEALSKPAGWSPISATSSYDKVSVSTASGAQPGTLAFTVKSTAKAHVVTSAATASVSSLSATVLTGNKNLTLEIGTTATGGTTKHTLNAGGGTLAEIINAVNTADLGVRATAVNLGTGKYGLLLEAKSAGAAGTFTLTQNNGQSVMGATVATAGSDASIQIGNLVVSSPTNTFTNVLPGVNVTLGPDAVANTTVTATMATDPKTLVDSVKALVDGLNSVLTDIDNVTKTGDGTVKKGPLAGDPGLRDLRNQLVDTLYSAAGTGLSGVGIQLDRSGKFVFDEAKFKTAYEADPAAVAAAFTKGTTVTGFADRLAVVAKQASDSVDGTVTLAINGRKSTIDRIKDSIERWDDRLELRRTTLTRQYTALETALGQMNSQSSWLAGQIASLPKMS